MRKNTSLDVSSWRAFTLIELLVSIAVIAVLAALLLTGVNRAKQKSMATGCISNLRQWGMAVNLYTGDNNDHLPFAIIKHKDPDQNNFHGLLYAYLARLPFSYRKDFITGVSSCALRLSEPVGVHNRLKISYGMNLHNSVNYTNADPRTFTHVAVREPSRTLLIAELSTGHDHPILFDHPNYAEALANDPHPAVTNQLGYRHSGRVNVLFMDCHAQSVARFRQDLILNFNHN